MHAFFTKVAEDK